MSGTRAHLDFNTWDIPIVAFVDAQFGNNGTGVLGDGNKPYQTVNAALGVSDWVIVKPCTMTENIILAGANRNNKHIHCMDGVVFQSGGLQISSNLVTRAWWTGRAAFEGSSCNLIRIISSDVELDFECAYASNARIVLFSEGSVLNTNPRVRFKADWIRANCFNGAGYAIRVIGGSNFTLDIAYFIESQHTIYEVRGDARGSLRVNCPRSQIIPNYTSNFGNANKSVIKIGDFSRQINVVINGDLISTHNSAGINTNDARSIMDIVQITDSVNNPTVTINGNLDNLLSPCISTGFSAAFGRYNINGNITARNVAGGYAGSPIFATLDGIGTPSSLTLNVKNSIIQGSTRIIVGRGRFFRFIQSSFFNADANAIESAFFCEQTGLTNQELFLYNCYIQTANGGVLPELVKGNAVGAIVGTVDVKANVPFGATYVDLWGNDYANQPALIVPQI